MQRLSLAILLTFFSWISKADVPPDFLQKFADQHLSGFVNPVDHYVARGWKTNEKGEVVLTVKVYNQRKSLPDKQVATQYEIIFSSTALPLALTPDVQINRFADNEDRYIQPAITGKVRLPLDGENLVGDYDYSARIRSLFRADPALYPNHETPFRGHKTELTLTKPQVEVLGGVQSTGQPGLAFLYQKHLMGNSESPFFGAMVLPTGIGKTLVAIKYNEFVASMNGGKKPLVIFVVQDKQILTDAARKFEKHAKGETIARLFGGGTKTEITSDTRIILATRSTAYSRFGEILSHAYKYDGPVVFYRDEAHHTGRQGGQFSQMLELFMKGMGKQAQVVDLTATLWNEEEPRMIERYKGNVGTAFLTFEEYQRFVRGENVPLYTRIQFLRAIEKGWLSPLTSLSFHTKDIEGEAVGNHRRAIYADQIAIPQLLGLKNGTSIDTLDFDKIPEKNLRALRSYLRKAHQSIFYSIRQDIFRQMLKGADRKVAEYDRGLIFVPTIIHAEIYKLMLENLFEGTNIEFRMVHSKMTERGGKVVTENFDWLADRDRSSRNVHKYLINVAMGREGLDIPGINRIINISATDSIKILMQILGRGARPDAFKSGLRLSDWSGSFIKFFNEMPVETLAPIFRTQGNGLSSKPRLMADGRELSVDDLISLEFENLGEMLKGVLTEDLNRAIAEAFKEAEAEKKAADERAATTESEARKAEAPVEPERTAGPEERAPEAPPAEPETRAADPEPDRVVEQDRLADENRAKIQEPEPRSETERIFRQYGDRAIPTKPPTQERVNDIVHHMADLRNWRATVPEHIGSFLDQHAFRLGIPIIWYEGQATRNWEKTLSERLIPLWKKGIYRNFELMGPGGIESYQTSLQFKTAHEFFQDRTEFERLQNYAEFHWLAGTNEGRLLLAQAPRILEAIPVSSFSKAKHGSLELRTLGLDLDDPRWVQTHPSIDEIIRKSGIIMEGLGVSLFKGIPVGPDGRHHEISIIRAMILFEHLSGNTSLANDLNRVLFDPLLPSIWQRDASAFRGTIEAAIDTDVTLSRSESLFGGKQETLFKIPREIAIAERYLWLQDLMVKVAEAKGKTALKPLEERMTEGTRRHLSPFVQRPMIKTDLDFGLQRSGDLVFKTDFDHTLLREWVRLGYLTTPKTKDAAGYNLALLDARTVWMDGWRRVRGDLARANKGLALVDRELTKRYIVQTLKNFEARKGPHLIFATSEMDWLLKPITALDLATIREKAIFNKGIFPDIVSTAFTAHDFQIGKGQENLRMFSILPLVYGGVSVPKKFFPGVGPTTLGVLEALRLELQAKFPDFEKINFDFLLDTEKATRPGIVRAHELVVNATKEGEAYLDQARRRWLEVFDYLTARAVYERYFGKWNSSVTMKEALLHNERSTASGVTFKRPTPPHKGMSFEQQDAWLRKTYEHTYPNKTNIPDVHSMRKHLETIAAYDLERMYPEVRGFLAENWKLLSQTWLLSVRDAGVRYLQAEDPRSKTPMDLRIDFMQEATRLVEMGHYKVYSAYQLATDEMLQRILPEGEPRHFEFFSKPENYEFMRSYVIIHWLMSSEKGRNQLVRAGAAVGEEVFHEVLRRSHLAGNLEHWNSPFAPYPEVLRDPRWIQTDKLISRLELSEAAVLSFTNDHPSDLQGRPREVIPNFLRAAVAIATLPDSKDIRTLREHIMDRGFIKEPGVLTTLKNRNSKDWRKLEELLWMQALLKDWGDRNGLEALRATQVEVLPRTVELVDKDFVRPIANSGIGWLLPYGPAKRQMWATMDGMTYDVVELNELMRAGVSVIPRSLERPPGREMWFATWRKLVWDIASVKWNKSGEWASGNGEFFENPQRELVKAIPEHFMMEHAEWLMKPIERLFSHSRIVGKFTHPDITVNKFLKASYGPTVDLFEKPPILLILPFIIYAEDRPQGLEIEGLGKGSLELLDALSKVLKEVHGDKIDSLNLREYLELGRTLHGIRNLISPTEYHPASLANAYQESFSIDPQRRKWLTVVDYFAGLATYERVYGIAYSDSGNFNDTFVSEGAALSERKTSIERARWLMEYFEDLKVSKRTRLQTDAVDGIIERMILLDTWAEESPREHIEFMIQNWRRLSLPWMYYLQDRNLSVDELRGEAQKARELQARGATRVYEAFFGAIQEIKGDVVLDSNYKEVTLEELKPHFDFFNQTENYEFLRAFIDFHVLLSSEAGRTTLANRNDIVDAIQESPLFQRMLESRLMGETGKIHPLLLDPRWSHSSGDLVKRWETLDTAPRQQDALQLLHPSVFRFMPPGPDGLRQNLPLIRGLAMTAQVGQQHGTNKYFHGFFADPGLIEDESLRRLLRNNHAIDRTADLNSAGYRDALEIQISAALQGFEELLWVQDLLLKATKKKGTRTVIENTLWDHLWPTTMDLIKGEEVRGIIRSTMGGNFATSRPEWKKMGAVISTGVENTAALSELMREGLLEIPSEMDRTGGRVAWYDALRRTVYDLDRADQDMLKKVLEDLAKITDRRGVHFHLNPIKIPKKFATSESAWLMDPVMDLLEHVAPSRWPRSYHNVSGVYANFKRIAQASYGYSTKLAPGTPIVMMIPFFMTPKEDLLRTPGVGESTVEALEVAREAFLKKYGERYKALNLEKHFEWIKFSETLLIPTIAKETELARGAVLGGSAGTSLMVDWETTTHAGRVPWAMKQRSQSRRVWTTLIDHYVARIALKNHFGEEPYENIETQGQPERGNPSKPSGPISCRAFL